MENKDIKREKAMKRFMASKALKKKHVEQMVQYMKKSYEEKTGLSADYVFVM
ncbi:MAG: hypothetical protein KBT15_04220 [Bacteroidales bacterium]|nr:hypothetical protein [Candidatus Minthousia equi]